MDTEDKVPDRELGLARFSERVVAFCVDAAPFVLGFHLLFGVVSRGGVTAGGYALCLALWTALFLIYQAFMSCEGRISLGKRLMGLRIVTMENEPLGLGQAVMRSVTYMASSVMSLGFLWSLFNKSRQCWHDMVIGSVVVHSRRGTPKALLLARVGAAACLLIIGVSYMWTQKWAPRYYGIRAVAFAHMGMDEMARLQRVHLLREGRYAEDVFALSKMSTRRMQFLRHMATLYDTDFGIKFQTTKDGYAIVARARNPRRTLIRKSG